MAKNNESKLKEARAFRDLHWHQLQEVADTATEAAANPSVHLLFTRKFARIESIREKFMIYHKEVLSLLANTTNPDYGAEEKLRKDFDTCYFAIEEIYFTIFPPSTNNSPAATSTNQSQHSQPQVRLPKINLPQFDGNLTQWTTFMDLFQTLVHQNPTLSPVEKFQYSILSLSGEPLSLVKAVPLNGNNYIIAYNSLVERYDNKRLLASTYWHAIESAPKSTSESHVTLRSLLNTFAENLAALELLNIDNWDFVLFTCLLDKLDLQTRKLFERSLTGNQIPTFDTLKKFLEQQCRALETSAVGLKVDSSNKPRQKPKEMRHSNKSSLHSNSNNSPSNTSMIATASSQVSTNSQTCPLCTQGHSLQKCPAFGEKSPKDRFDLTKRLHLCINCLKPSHTASSCPSTHNCRECQSRHHTLLHFGSSTSSRNANSNQSQPIATSNNNSSTGSNVLNLTSYLQPSAPSAVGQVLLSTIQLDVLDRGGVPHTLRAILDSGSQISLIRQKCLRKLGLSPVSSNTTSILGIGNTLSTTCGLVSLQIRPTSQLSPSFSLQAVVVPEICSAMPHHFVDHKDWSHISGLKLADPNWDIPSPIDLLLGADVFARVVRSGTISGPQDHPLAIQTIFGWVLMGPTPNSNNIIQTLLTLSPPSLEETVRRFWEVESIPVKPIQNPDDELAEDLFTRSVYRLPCGRFGVSLPFKNPNPSFVDSQSIADRRWLRLESRLLKQPKLYQAYLDFMQDYLDSHHMSLISSTIPNDAYVIPHHCVVKDEGDKTKIRVVFDASARDTQNSSLNDTLLTGPKLQNDIVAVLLRFRSKEFVFTCDIRQMYRQILIDPNDRKFQFIRFRFSPDQPVQTFQLNTVTYGVSSAPFLAIRTLLHLAEVDGAEFPLAVDAIQNNLYVDDFACGSDTIKNTKLLKSQLVQLLKKGGFQLRKWASNSPELIEDLPESYCLSAPSTIDAHTDQIVRILGLQWDFQTDSFSFQVSVESRTCTKRTLLSLVARIYDPMGFLAPISLLLKGFVQHLWKLGLDWDDPPSDNILSLWNRFLSELPSLTSIKIPRLAIPASVGCQLHAFCDASQRGYAAVIYIRYIIEDKPVVRLLISKTKVAPLNNKRIPRLELCAAVLLTKLVTFVLETYLNMFQFQSIFAWTDSSIVLFWLASPAYRWNTFVSNRVAYIQERLPFNHWRHVTGDQNPADAPSRGLFPDELIAHRSWLTGPEFLHMSEESWPPSIVPINPPEDVSLEESKTTLVVTVSPSLFLNLFEKYSSLNTISRVVAYVLRFVSNIKPGIDKRKGNFTELELHKALLILTREVQHVFFANDMKRIQDKKTPSNQLRRLSPFIDNEGILRVGGRLRHANVPFETKHPAILPQRHMLTDMIINQTHSKHLHPGINSTMHLVRQKFWILSCRRVVSRCLKRCLKCIRQHPIPFTPAMGDLPAARLSQVKAFLRTGVDFAGPFFVTMLRKRGAKSYKVYLCLFICFSIKAVHLEIVTDLTVDAFLAALRRFIARRGTCAKLFSDCGTNFVGASRELYNYMHQATQSQLNNMENSDIGTLVLIKDDNIPPLRWKLARIIELHPGADGICRVATVKTANGNLKRPMAKLCPLPIHEPLE